MGNKFGPPVVMGDESIMSKKAHGTSAVPVQKNLRWDCDQKTASNICNYNRHYAEHSGYYEGKPKFLAEAKSSSKIEFRDSNTGKVLFTAPIGRSMDDFLIESKAHGWPSFRDQETNWEYVRVLRDGECVSVDGTHLGHNLPDRKGNRYCISKSRSLSLSWVVFWKKEAMEPRKLTRNAFQKLSSFLFFQIWFRWLGTKTRRCKL